MRVCIEYDDPLVAKLIHSSLSRYFNIENTSAAEASLQWSSYESISFETILSNHQTLCNSYIFRKALIRKHFLANTIQNWLAKHPQSILNKSVPKTYLLECDYADYLDEALNECFELREELGRKLFILKPSMTDRGQGIRLFSTYEELQAIFEEFEGNDDDVDDENQNEDNDDTRGNGKSTSTFRCTRVHFATPRGRQKVPYSSIRRGSRNNKSLRMVRNVGIICFKTVFYSKRNGSTSH